MYGFGFIGKMKDPIGESISLCSFSVTRGGCWRCYSFYACLCLLGAIWKLPFLLYQLCMAANQPAPLALRFVSQLPLTFLRFTSYFSLLLPLCPCSLNPLSPLLFILSSLYSFCSSFSSYCPTPVCCLAVAMTKGIRLHSLLCITLTHTAWRSESQCD